MGGRDKIRIAVGVVGVVALGVVLALPGAVMASPFPAPGAHCGPGPGWVSTCPSGTDSFNSTSDHSIIEFDPEDGGVIIELPDLSGEMRVFRGAGSAGHIDTEIISLVLSGGGFTLRAGDGTGNLLNDGPLYSPGAIDEVVPGPSLFANSFFDVFFELDATPFGPLHNNSPCTMRSVIDRVPPSPGTEYLCDAEDIPLDLFDAGGIHRAVLTGPVTHLVGEHFHPTPEPSTLLLFGSGLVGLGAAAWRRTRNSR